MSPITELRQQSCFNESPGKGLSPAKSTIHLDGKQSAGAAGSSYSKYLSHLTEEESMTGPPRFRRVHWMLLAVLALAPAGVLAQQQENASQVQKPQDQKQQDQKQQEQKQQEPEPAAQPKTEAAPGQSENPQAKTEEDAKLISVPGSKSLGMSILGNQEAPKALVIVPWKSSELGNGLDVSTMLDDSRSPVDREVFMRMLNYYEIRSATASAGTPAKTNSAQPATGADRRSQ